jgi:hypothetical protein
MLLRTIEVQNLFKDYSEIKKLKKQPRFWYFYDCILSWNQKINYTIQNDSLSLISYILTTAPSSESKLTQGLSLLAWN